MFQPVQSSCASQIKATYCIKSLLEQLYILFSSSQRICWTCPEGVLFSVWRTVVLPILNVSIGCYYFHVFFVVFFLDVSILLCYAKNFCVSEIGISSQLWDSTLKFTKKYKIQTTDYTNVLNHITPGPPNQNQTSIILWSNTDCCISGNIYSYLVDHNSRFCQAILNH